MKPIKDIMEVRRERKRVERIKKSLKFCGKNLIVENGVVIKNPENIVIGDNVQLRKGCMIYASSGTSSENKESQPYIKIGNNVHIKENAILNTYGGFIVLGDNVNIGQGTVLYGNGGITVGKDSGIGPLSLVVASNHNYNDNSQPFRLQGETKKGITIGDNVWCAGGVSICDGVEIGDNVVIGTGSVVRKKIPRNAVVMGNPAQIAFIKS